MWKHIFVFITLLFLFQKLNAQKFTTLSLKVDSTKGCNNIVLHDSIASLGIYGGITNDLAINNKGRIFAAMQSPLSLFYSDDSCQTWHHSFPYDSLEYECGFRGWGGAGQRVFANAKGWIAVQTKTDNYGSTIISFNNGDSGTYKTAMDEFLFKQYSSDSRTVACIGLSNYYMYSCLGKYICLIDTSQFNYSTDVIDITTKISGINSFASVIAIAPFNDSLGFPFYALIDTSDKTYNNQGNGTRLLYKYDGSNFTQINMPSALTDPQAVFVHPNYDTLFITGYTSSLRKTYRSYDSGNSWTDISYSGSILGDADYSSAWISTMPLSNGLALIAGDGTALSKDLGDTWDTINVIQSSRLGMNPNNEQMLVCANHLGEQVGYGGVSGTFSLATNQGLEAIQINKIARNANKTIFYIATQFGLAYTTKYLDSIIPVTQKWQSPNGEFPVASIFNNGGESLAAVAIDPTDSLHVIAGGASQIFYTTTTGPTGFLPFGAIGLNNDPDIRDIAFINSTTIVAVSGGNVDGTAGNIWRSPDGGLNWQNVSPSGFCCGNTVAVAKTPTDTLVYVGAGTNSTQTLYNGKLFSSNDNGLTWSLVNKGPHGSLTDTITTGLAILDIAVHPGKKDTLYLACGQNTDHAFVRSTDGGITYHYPVISGEGNANAIMINAENPDSDVYVAFKREVYKYNPAIDSILFLFRGYPGENILDLQQGSILMASTTGFYGILYDAEDDLTIDTTYTQVKENEKSILGLQLYPNPSSDFVKIKLPKSSSALFEIYDIFGKLIKEELCGNKSNTIAIDIKNFSCGTYFVKTTINNQCEYVKFVVMR